jgi:hypothetical protein
MTDSKMATRGKRMALLTEMAVRALLQAPKKQSILVDNEEKERVKSYLIGPP